MRYKRTEESCCNYRNWRRKNRREDGGMHGRKKWKKKEERKKEWMKIKTKGKTKQRKIKKRRKVKVTRQKNGTVIKEPSVNVGCNVACKVIELWGQALIWLMNKWRGCKRKNRRLKRYRKRSRKSG